MAKIMAPNTDYDGETASVPFVRGEGYTTDPYLIGWFKCHGYTVKEEPKETVEDKPKGRKQKAAEANE